MPTVVANKKKQGALLPNAWRRRAPRNNQNARKHGLFTRQAKDERKQLYAAAHHPGHAEDNQVRRRRCPAACQIRRVEISALAINCNMIMQ
jgi:hypothetical protein